jgi:AcrR family transcriptional regulator
VTNDDTSERPLVKPRRARRSDGVRSDAAILEAAARLFLERGYDAVSMDDIGGAAGLARQTVYNRFRDKEDVFAATIERHWANWGWEPIAHLAWLHGEGRLLCPRPDIAAGEFFGLVQEFCVWPKVMGLTDSLALTPPTNTMIDEAIATFMARYGAEYGDTVGTMSI